MRFDIVTIFPEFFAGPLDYGIVRRARESGLIDVRVQDLRAVHARPPSHRGRSPVRRRRRHGAQARAAVRGRRVAAWLRPAPAGEPTENAASAGSRRLARLRPALPASGKLFRQATARRFAALDRVVLLCGRYEGVDERVAEHLATEELSIGDFVLSGGELPAALVVDAVTRLLPGALGNEASSLHESFSACGKRHSGCMRRPPRGPRPAPPSPARALLLDFPHYTRPAEFRGWAVPEVLLGGNHEEIRRWRERIALEKTRRNRPDLLDDPL